MISILSKKNCCSCTACVSVCPKQCIEMRADGEGFNYPTVKADACINCGKCESVCPVIHNEICFINNFNIEGYIVRDKRHDVVAASTSGGFFTSLAEYVLKKGGVVYGAEFDDDFRVHHTRILDISGIGKFRGSKYVASDINGIFIDVKQDLITNKKVLFTGVPCQIAGLKSFLQKEYDNLITMDVICRGTPSPLFWKKHLEYQGNKYKSKIQFVRIRNKTSGYHSSTMLIEFVNGKKIYESARTNYYLKAFFADICSKPHCYNCAFKHEEHCSDFTVYDAWHAAQLADIKDDDKGWTNMMIQSQKGHEFFEKINNNFEYFKINYKKAIELDGIMVKNSVPWNENRKHFFEKINEENFKEHCQNYVNVSLKDIAIEKLKRVYYWIKFLGKIVRKLN